jgi:hypothetical protein
MIGIGFFGGRNMDKVFHQPLGGNKMPRFGGPAMLSRGPEAVTARSVPGWAVATVLVAGLVTSGVLGYTGKLGGQIRHTEFVPGGEAAAMYEDEHEAESDDD